MQNYRVLAVGKLIEVLAIGIIRAFSYCGSRRTPGWVEWILRKFKNLYEIWLPLNLQRPKSTGSGYCPLWPFPFELPLKVFKTRILGRGLHNLLKKFFFLLTNQCEISQSTPSLGLNILADMTLVPFSRCETPQSAFFHGLVSLLAHRLVFTPLWGSAASLTYRPVSGFDTICNGPSPPLAYIVFFGLIFPQDFLNESTRERFPHVYKECFVLFPTDMGSHNPPISIGLYMLSS